MDGEEITLEDAKQVKLSKPVLTTILPFLKNEVASTAQEVMTALNNYAAAQAKTIKLQGEAKLGGRALLTAQRKAALRDKLQDKSAATLNAGRYFTAKTTKADGTTTDGGTVNEQAGTDRLLGAGSTEDAGGQSQENPGGTEKVGSDGGRVRRTPASGSSDGGRKRGVNQQKSTQTTETDERQKEEIKNL